MHKKLKRVRANKWFKMYRDSDGKRYVKWGNSSVRRFRLWPKRRLSRWGLSLVIVILVGWAAYYPVMHYTANKVIEQVADKLLTPEEIKDIMASAEFQRIVQEQAAAKIESSHKPSAAAEASNLPKPSATSATTNSDKPQDAIPATAPDKVRFSTNDEALKFLLTKFSMSELKSLANKAGGGLTNEKKAEIKAIVMQKLSPEEFDALKILAVIELQKRNGVIEVK